tara:strand:- start:209 stop:421 length:213 start_codon:yes stop_codon:yes gene_type:complete
MTNGGTLKTEKELRDRLTYLEQKRENVLGGFNEDKGHTLSDQQFDKLDKIYNEKLQIRKALKEIKEKAVN